ncbi:hypothetical protein AGMMS50212_04490 [Spirochaetia bacterium]|nr:hypothetical protein AGMMS50212_04490 [Spirochaetia bacterium]
MIKHNTPVLLSLVLLFGLVSCASSPKVTRVSTDTAIDLSGYWNDTDVRTVADSLIDKMEKAKQVTDFVSDYGRKNKGEHPTVIVGTFRNNSSEHINTQIIANMMRTSIINGGVFAFVEGGKAREDIRAEREDQNAGNAANSVGIGREAAADFMLSGEVNSIVDSSGNQTVRSYFVKATLTNTETNRILWEGDNNEIKKVIVRPKIKL